jgi:CBS domain-containing protein
MEVINLKVSEIMTIDLVWLNEDNNCGEATEKMKQFNIGDVLVNDGETKLKGIITDRDIALRVVADKLDPWQTKLSEVATFNPVTVSPDTPISDAAELMAEHQVRRLPILSNGKLMGIISLGDLAVDAPDESEVEETLEEISQPTR